MPGQAGTVSTTVTGAGATGVATTTGAVTTTGNGNPTEKPKRTPAFADIAAAPTSAAMRSIFVFIMFFEALLPFTNQDE
jgi:hypothetical protein